MEVKGTAFVAREKAMVAAFGEARWKAFLQAAAEQLPLFRRRVTALTRMPVADFLALNDRLVNEFFGGDPLAFWQMGEKSAEWGLTDGPYAIYRRDRNIEAFVRETLPSIWTGYFSRGKVVGTIADKVVDVRIQEVPVLHPYFELVVMGYCRRGFELVAGQSKPEKIAGAQKPGDEIHYRFQVG
ncbi:MAG: hypothetical protein QM765_51765 [Myxococcales bacterium]